MSPFDNMGRLTVIPGRSGTENVERHGRDFSKCMRDREMTPWVEALTKKT